MGKTRKALKRAEDQYRKLNNEVLKEALPNREVAIPSGQYSVKKRKDRYEDLKNNLLARNFDGSIKIILFINTCNEDESEDHAYEFSVSLGEKFRRDIKPTWPKQKHGFSRAQKKLLPGI